MKKIVHLTLILLMIIPNMTAYAASTACSSKSFVVANWKGEIPRPSIDEIAAPVNEPEEEHSEDDAKRTADELVGEENENPSEPGGAAPPDEGTVKPEDDATADDAAHEGEQPVEPANPEGEKHTEPMDEIPSVDENVGLEMDAPPVVETEENEKPANEAIDEPAPIVEDAPPIISTEDGSENGPKESEQ